MTEVEVRALLLDLDGTLVDSTAAVARCWTRMAGRLGIDPATIVGKYHGMPASTALDLVSALPDGAWAIVTSGTVELAHARLRAAGR